MRPTSWSPSSIRPPRRPAPSSSTPIPAAWRWAHALVEAYEKALACDPRQRIRRRRSPSTGTLDGATAEEITKIFTEVIIAPDADADARRILAARGKSAPADRGRPARSACGRPDLQVACPAASWSRRATTAASRATTLKIVTKRQPTEQEIADMLFAFTVGKHVKSNTIVYAKAAATAGIGAGQMSRVDSARIAANKARDAAKAAGWAEPQTSRFRGGIRRLLPLPRRIARHRRSGRHGGHPAGRLDPRQGCDRSGRRGRPCHGLHGHAPLPALSLRP